MPTAHSLPTPTPTASTHNHHPQPPLLMLGVGNLGIFFLQLFFDVGFLGVLKGGRGRYVYFGVEEEVLGGRRKIRRDERKEKEKS